MVSSEEKRKLIEDLIKMAYKKTKPLHLQHKLHELLLRDTNGGKLYKYRSFDKDGYSLKNLQEGTLHCSEADAFNDPFDCKIGVTIQSLCTAKYETEFDVVGGILATYISVAQGEKSIEACSDNEQRMIKKLLDSQLINKFIFNLKSMNGTQEEMEQLLKNNAYVIGELMQIVLSDETFKDSLGICANMMPRMMKNISPEGILMLLDDNLSLADYARANGITDDTDEIGLTMLLGQKLQLENNDAIENMKKLIEDMDHKLANKIKGLFRVGCLCTSYKNKLMWSHYAEGHKGFCIEYDFSETDEDVLSKLPFPVFYSENRPLIPWKAAIENSAENIDRACEEIIMSLLTKDKDWEYENEWRILISVKENAELLMPRISCIYLGALIEESNRNIIIDVAKRYSIPVKQMKVDRGVYDLHAENVF